MRVRRIAMKCVIIDWQDISYGHCHVSGQQFEIGLLRTLQVGTYNLWICDICHSKAEDV